MDAERLPQGGVRNPKDARPRVDGSSAAFRRGVRGIEPRPGTRPNRLGLDERVGESLVVPLGVVVGDVLANRATQRVLALFDNSFDAVVMGTQVVDQGFGLGIGGQRNNQIRVSRKPRFSSNGDGQTADERERDPGLSEFRADLTKGGLE